MSAKLTVIIPCKNEHLNLRACIATVRTIADEVLIADSGSTDGSLAIAEELGCRIIEREYFDSGNFKNWAIPQAEHPWVLIVDADERVTPELATEITHALAAPECDGYRIHRRNFLFGYEIRHSGWSNDSVLRLFRRDLGRYGAGGDHADVEVSTGNIGHLRQKLLHFTYWSLPQYLRKAERYTTQAAALRFARGQRARLWAMALVAPLRFFYLYVLRLGFLDGVPGLIVCGLTAFNSFTKLANLWVLEHGKSPPDDEDSALPAPSTAQNNVQSTRAQIAA